MGVSLAFQIASRYCIGRITFSSTLETNNGCFLVPTSPKLHRSLDVIIPNWEAAFSYLM